MDPIDGGTRRVTAGLVEIAVWWGVLIGLAGIGLLYARSGELNLARFGDRSPATAPTR